MVYLAPAAAPTSSIFYKPLLIGRTRRSNGPEMVINALPFGPSDRDAIEKFTTSIATAFVPRPQGSRTAIAAASGHTGERLPAAFDAFRAVAKRTGKNMAAIWVEKGNDHRGAYYAGIWAAIRAGWRDGYSAGVEITVDGESLDSAKGRIRDSAAFSAFCIDATRLCTADESALEERFERSFTAEERGWILDEFAAEFSVEDAIRLSVRFGKGLKAIEQLHEFIRQARSAMKAGKSFDLEVSLEGGEVTGPRELAFCLHWLKARGHAAQLAAPRLVEGNPQSDRLGELSVVARHYQCTLSIRGRAGWGAEALGQIARATMGRVHYKIAGDPENSADSINFAAEHLVG